MTGASHQKTTAMEKFIGRVPTESWRVKRTGDEGLGFSAVPPRFMLALMEIREEVTE